MREKRNEEKGTNKLCRISINTAVVLVSILAALACIELGVRIMRPDMANVVKDAKFPRENPVGFANPKNNWGYRLHPDNKTEHPVIFNNLGSRQHRNLPQKKDENTIDIAVLGDSLTANVLMKAEYSFTEPLDYLLNRTGKRYNVYNFGAPGYGADQLFLHYINEISKMQPDILIYMYYINDIPEMISNNLLSIDERGQIFFLPPKQSFYKRIIKNFYITYFFIERTGRWLDIYPAGTPLEEILQGKKSKKIDSAIQLFSKIVEDMANDVKMKGKNFLLCLIPSKDKRADAFNNEIEEILGVKKIETVNLSPLFNKQTVPYDNFFFKNDAHWNEEGNKLAAVYLFKSLTEMLTMDISNPDEFIKEGLYEYYGSFAESPSSTGLWLKEVFVPYDIKEKIRDKYLELELEAKTATGKLN